jgi:hypothetical protein
MEYWSVIKDIMRLTITAVLQSSKTPKFVQMVKSLYKKK